MIVPLPIPERIVNTPPESEPSNLAVTRPSDAKFCMPALALFPGPLNEGAVATHVIRMHEPKSVGAVVRGLAGEPGRFATAIKPLTRPSLLSGAPKKAVSGR